MEPWTSKEMPGIDLEVTVHRLKAYPAHKPVVQKTRWSSPARVVEKIERLIEADTIKEVQYPHLVGQYDCGEEE